MKNLLMLFVLLVCSCEQSGTVKKQRMTSQISSNAALNLLRNLESEGELKTYPIPAGTGLFNFASGEFFNCVEKRVIAKKEDGNVVIIVFLKEKITDAPVAIQLEVTNRLWTNYQRCTTVYFKENPERHLEFQNSCIERGGEVYQFWILKGLVE